MPDEIAQAISENSAAIREAAEVARSKEGKANDALPLLATERTELETLRAERDKAAAKAEIDAVVKEAVKAALLDVRAPSIAAQVGSPGFDDAVKARVAQNVHPAFKAWVPNDYTPGD